MHGYCFAMSRTAMVVSSELKRGTAKVLRGLGSFRSAMEKSGRVEQCPVSMCLARV